MEAEYKNSFRIQLGLRLQPPQALPENITNRELCQIYENLPFIARRGLWPDVARAIGQNEQWAAKRYHNTFRKALYSQQMSFADRHIIVDTVLMNLHRLDRAHSIVTMVKMRLEGRDIFPSSIESITYQIINRIKQYLREGKDLSQDPWIRKYVGDAVPTISDDDFLSGLQTQPIQDSTVFEQLSKDSHTGEQQTLDVATRCINQHTLEEAGEVLQILNALDSNEDELLDGLCHVFDIFGSAKQQ